MRVAITGNIGCGKTTFTQMLMQHLPNFRHFCIDTAVRDLYKDKSFQYDLTTEFGTCVRSEVSDIVFKDPAKRKWLEDLSKRKIGYKLDNELIHSNVIVEFPLVYEMGASERFDYIITCFTDDDTQKARVLTRDGITEEKLNLIRGVQLSTTLKTTLADRSVDTSISLHDLELLAANVARDLIQRNNQFRFMEIFGKEEHEGACKIYDELMKAYRDRERFYHNEHHIFDMLEKFDTVSDNLNYPVIVHLAIWFHDLVYNTYPDTYPLNEQNSVRRMVDLMAKYTPSALNEVRDLVPLVAAAGEFILATKGHKITSPFILNNEKLLHDCQVFLDIDLSVLGGTQSEVDEYDHNIWLEFSSHYNERQFADGRRQVLETFLQRDKLFLSPYFADLELPARENIRTLISKWENPYSVYNRNGDGLVRPDNSGT